MSNKMVTTLSLGKNNWRRQIDTTLTTIQKWIKTSKTYDNIQ